MPCMGETKDEGIQDIAVASGGSAADVLKANPIRTRHAAVGKPVSEVRCKSTRRGKLIHSSEQLSTGTSLRAGVTQELVQARNVGIRRADGRRRMLVQHLIGEGAGHSRRDLT